MLIVYRKSDGQVMDNTGINSMFPEGVPNQEDVIDNVVTVHGGTKEEYGYLRLHDTENASIVNKTFTHEYTIQKDEIVFGDERQQPEELPQPPSEIELLKQENAILQIAIAETIEKQETDQVQNQVALAEIIETLNAKGVL